MVPKSDGMVWKYSAEWWSRFHSVDEEGTKQEEHGAPSTAHTSSSRFKKHGPGRNISEPVEKPHQHD